MRLRGRTERLTASFGWVDNSLSPRNSVQTRSGLFAMDKQVVGATSFSWASWWQQLNAVRLEENAFLSQEEDGFGRDAILQKTSMVLDLARSSRSSKDLGWHRSTTTAIRLRSSGCSGAPLIEMSVSHGLYPTNTDLLQGLPQSSSSPCPLMDQ